MPKETIIAKGVEIGIYTDDFENEFISLTDIARYRNEDDPRFIIQNWMKNRHTIEFLAAWEELHNPNFKRLQMHTFRNDVSLNRFVMTPEKWIKATNAKGIVSKRGRYGSGTYAHSDIAMRLKTDENSRLSLNWNLKREISKLNYRVHTDAIKKNLIPPELTSQQIHFTYASEGDLLNVALFGMTAKEWRESNKGKSGNIRDYASIGQLLVLANLESYNAILIGHNKTQSERLVLLREMVKKQLASLSGRETKLLGNDTYKML